MSNEISNFLTSLAADIAGLRSRADQASREGLEANKDIGEKLCEGKEVLKRQGDRRFREWAIEKTGYGKSWIALLMKLSNEWHRIEPQLSTAVDFSVKGALALAWSPRLSHPDYERAKELLDAWKASDEPPEGEAYGKFKDFAYEKRMDADTLRVKVQQWALSPPRLQREPLKAQVTRLEADNAHLTAEKGTAG
jgi:hypothetical protein